MKGAEKEEAMAAYDAGTLTTEEALACEIVKAIDVFPAIDEDGTYHIANTAQYVAFADIANANTTSDNGKVYNAVLDGDVFVNNNMIIAEFFGTLDGQDHTINVDIERSENNAAIFTNVRGGNIRNLILRGTITTSVKFAAGVAAHTFDECTFDRIQSYVDIVGNVDGDGTHGGIVAVNETGTTYINNSVFAGSMSGNANSNGGFVGWSASASKVNGCLIIANITAPDSGSNIIGRNNTSALNCYFVTPYGSKPATGATQVTEEQLLSGEVTYGLNGGYCGRDAAWRQDLGNDVMPTLDPTHLVVYKTEDGTYTNEAPVGIESVTDKKPTDGRIYNINGILVEKTSKGLYIINGKKVLVK